MSLKALDLLENKPISEWPIYYKDGLPFIYDDEFLFYDENGERMGQDPRHIDLATYLRELLRWRYRGQHYGIGSEVTFRARENSRGQSVAERRRPKRRTYVEITPDVAFVPGVPRLESATYKIGPGQPAPTVVFEIGSKSTYQEDLGRKFRLYQYTYKVREYFVYDPLEERLWQGPRLRAWRLVRRQYVEIEPDERGWVWSEELQSFLLEDGPSLRLYDENGNKRLDEAEEERVRADEEKQRADDLETQIQELRAQLEKLNQEKQN